MKYKILIGNCASDLQKEVRSAIEVGYEPIGGISVTAVHETWTNERKGWEESSTEYCFYQAVIKSLPTGDKNNDGI